MPPVRSAEIESVARRTVLAYIGDFPTLRNLMSSDPSFRVLGFDRDEWWRGPDEFFGVRATQVEESPNLQLRIDEVEGFEEGGFGWATIFTTIIAPEASTHLRHTALFRLEAGVWRAIQWHNSTPVSNQAVFGVELTKTLDDLVSSVLGEESHLLPSSASEGTLTLAFTDIVDSTSLAESYGDASWARLMAEHESLLGSATAANGGNVVKFLGDGSMLAFESARAAVRAAIDIQHAVVGGPFSVRIGVHTGEVQRTGTDLMGLTVNKAARVASATGGGEIMISSTTRDLIGSMDGFETGEAKTVALKGMSGTHQILPVLWR
ncbi:MAG: adenylate/guanylate cyclase domain-containing protein [Acidimicrobiia bacterium]